MAPQGAERISCKVPAQELFSELGVNFLRGAHYPFDPRILDLCDERGILVWSEAIGWQNTEADFVNPRFIEQQVEAMEEMVLNAQNHASVVVWAFLNEGASDSLASSPVLACLGLRAGTRVVRARRNSTKPCRG